MRGARAWFMRVGGLFSKARRERELADELESHLQLHIEDNLRTGMPPVEARRQALIRLGGMEQAKEVYRDRASLRWVETVIQDVRYGLRMLAKDPGFTAIALVTLALGIGGTTAIFSVVECALLDPFPYADSHRLVMLAGDNIAQGKSDWAWLHASEFMDYQEQNHVFDEVVGSTDNLVLMTGSQQPAYFPGTHLTANAFCVLGVPPLIGRPLTAEDSKPGAPPVVVLGYDVWQNKFGGDPRIIGRNLILDAQPTTVIGVMPRRFTWMDRDLYLPLILSRSKATDERQSFLLVGHLKPGVSIEQAEADVAVLERRFAAIYPKDHPRELTFSVHSLAKGSVSESFRSSVYLLLAAVGLLLLIACANIANLLLARATAREKEFALRAALGASRFRLARLLLIESLLLALGGAVLGCLLAWDVLGGLVAFIPPGRLPSEAVVRINGPVLSFALATALLSTLFFGLAPALQVARKDLQEPMKGGGESSRHNRLRSLLVVSEVALSMILLCGSGLLMRSFFALLHVDIGFDPDRVLVGGVNLPKRQYKTAEQRVQFTLESLHRLRALPGALSAALINSRVGGGRLTNIEIAGEPSSETQQAAFSTMSDRYFETMRIRLLQGRSISEQDLANARNVAVINEIFTKEYFKGENPLGQRIRIKELETGSDSVKNSWFEVVGVVADIRGRGPEAPVAPEIYIPYTFGGVHYVLFVIRTGITPASMVKSVQQTIWSMDKDLPVDLEAKTVREYKDLQWFSEYRFELILLVMFASLGLTLVSIGAYSVLSYAVSRRTREIGIRMALGAQAAEVRWLLLKAGLRWLMAGIAIGVPASIALARVLQNRIWGIKTADPLTLAAVSLVLTAVGLAACYIPARRATKVDPMVALRFE
jgi:putative ABC transport system permease protein